MNLAFERRLWEEGFKFVAGVDEVGRGPLAGPVVAAAVIFPPGIVKINGLADSKLLTPRERERLLPEIKKKAIAIGIGKVSHTLIDKINIGQANLLAMKRAVEKLPIFPDYLLIDGGRYRISLPLPQQGINGGDGKCFSIAAASIVAKVFRDQLMLAYHKKYPQYRFDCHKGYGTKEHLLQLRRYGSSPIHRQSFFPVSHSS